MKRMLAILCISVLLLSSLSVIGMAEENSRCIIYVAETGSDTNDGSLNAPLATIKAARDKIRTLKKDGQYTGGYTVYVRGGKYHMSKGLTFTAQDSGTADAPISYCAYPGEKVTLIGGVSLNGKDFTKVTDIGILNRLADSEAKDKIYMLDLKTCGITDTGKPYWKGAYSYPSNYVSAGLIEKKPVAPGAEVLFNGNSMTLARYPNSGFMYVKTVVNSGYDMNVENSPVGAPFTITVDDGRISKWTSAPEGSILMYGLWKRDWADQTVPIKTIDVGSKRITSTVGSTLGVASGRPFYVYNLIEELDVPGEYYLDHEKNILYLYPESDVNNAEIIMTLTEEPLIYLENTQYINFKGIDIMGSRNHAYQIVRGSHNEIRDCEISCTESSAVHISAGYYNGIRDSYIHDVEGGAVIAGGMGSTLTPGYCYVENCEIEKFSRLSSTYVPAISVSGCGQLVRYNKIHNAPHLAITFAGVNNKIMYNEIYDVLQKTDDAGAIYSGMSWVDRGNNISYNYFHDLKVDSSVAYSSGIGAIYLDGGLCETTITGNVIENVAGKGIWINGGSDNNVQSNIMVNCTYGLYLSDIMYDVDFADHHYPDLESRTYSYTTCAWKRAFPRLQNMLQLSDDEKRVPRGNVFANNLCYKTAVSNETTHFSGKRIPITTYIDVSRNLKTDNDPGFENIAERNYQLKDSSVVFNSLSGFKKGSFAKMQSLTDRCKENLGNTVIMLTGSPLAFTPTGKTTISSNALVVPYEENGNVYVPVAFVSKSLGAAIQLNGVEVTVKNGEQMIALDDMATLLKKPSAFYQESGLIVIGENAENLFDEETTDTSNYLKSTLGAY